MTTEEAKVFIEEQIIPVAKVSTPQAICTLCEDLEALQIALASGNSVLVFAMANYISQIEGLTNSIEIAQKITAQVFKLN